MVKQSKTAEEIIHRLIKIGVIKINVTPSTLASGTPWLFVNPEQFNKLTNKYPDIEVKANEVRDVYMLDSSK